MRVKAIVTPMTFRLNARYDVSSNCRRIQSFQMSVDEQPDDIADALIVTKVLM